MTRIKAIFRGRGIRTPGRGVYQPKQREQWLETLTEPGIHQRAAWLYEQLDQLRVLRREAKQVMLAESQKHRAVSLLKTIPELGSIRATFILSPPSIRPIGFGRSGNSGPMWDWRWSPT
jgi:transposase